MTGGSIGQPSPLSGRGGIFIGIDIGGTFTDLTIHDLHTGETRAVKVPSNRAAPDSAVLAGLEASGVAPDDI